MYSHILVPIVFEHGKHGKDALEIATHLLAEGGKISLLHVMEDVPAFAAAYIPSGIRDEHRQSALTALESLAKSLDVPCEVHVEHGHASSNILNHSAHHAVDCVVIASHKPGYEDYFIGSTAARVVRHSKCAVHIMR